MNLNEDLTPQERVDGDLLRRLLGDEVRMNREREGRMRDQDDMHTREGNCCCEGEERRSREEGCGCGDRERNRRNNDTDMEDRRTLQTMMMSREGSCCGMKAREDDSFALSFGVPGGVLAALYIPIQEFDDLYDEDTALRRGTLFRALDLPFYGGKEGKFCD